MDSSLKACLKQLSVGGRRKDKGILLFFACCVLLLWEKRAGAGVVQIVLVLNVGMEKVNPSVEGRGRGVGNGKRRRERRAINGVKS